MVLVGVGMQAALYGGSITLTSKFDEDQSEFIANWFAGSIWGDEWAFVLAFLPWIVIILPYLLFKSNELNLINTHEHIAKGLGVKLERERIVLFCSSNTFFSCRSCCWLDCFYWLDGATYC